MMNLFQPQSQKTALIWLKSSQTTLAFNPSLQQEIMAKAGTNRIFIVGNSDSLLYLSRQPDTCRRIYLKSQYNIHDIKRFLDANGDNHSDNIALIKLLSIKDLQEINRMSGYLQQIKNQTVIRNTTSEIPTGAVRLHIEAFEKRMLALGKAIHSKSVEQTAMLDKIASLQSQRGQLQHTIQRHELESRDSSLLCTTLHDNVKKLRHYAQSRERDLVMLSKTTRKQMPLHAAIHQANPLMLLESMSSHRNKINAKDSDGNTPLHYAVIYQNIELIWALLIRGADLMIVNHASKVPADYDADDMIDLVQSTLVQYKQLTSLIERSSNAINNDSDTSTLENYLTTMRDSFALDALNEFGNSLLHIAVSKYDVNITNLLLTAGCKANIRNKLNKTPVQYAKMLLKIEADDEPVCHLLNTLVELLQDAEMSLQLNTTPPRLS